MPPTYFFYKKNFSLPSPPSLKRERSDDPLDLSSSQPTSKRIKAESDPTETGSSDEDPENWSVQKVVSFVETVETCQEYAEVNTLPGFEPRIFKFRYYYKVS